MILDLISAEISLLSHIFEGKYIKTRIFFSFKCAEVLLRIWFCFLREAKMVWTTNVIHIYKQSKTDTAFFEAFSEEQLWLKTPYNINNLSWKTVFDGRLPSMEDTLYGRWPFINFEVIPPLVEENMWWKMTFDSLEDNLQ